MAKDLTLRNLTPTRWELHRLERGRLSSDKCQGDDDNVQRDFTPKVLEPFATEKLKGATTTPRKKEEKEEDDVIWLWFGRARTASLNNDRRDEWEKTGKTLKCKCRRHPGGRWKGLKSNKRSHHAHTTATPVALSYHGTGWGEKEGRECTEVTGLYITTKPEGPRPSRSRWARGKARGREEGEGGAEEEEEEEEGRGGVNDDGEEEEEEEEEEEAFLVLLPPTTHLRNWMSQLPSHTPLTHLSIPGTHNSHTYRRALPLVRCQAVDVATQLRNGVRFLDVRVSVSPFVVSARSGSASTSTSHLQSSSSASSSSSSYSSSQPRPGSDPLTISTTGLGLVHGPFPAAFARGDWTLDTVLGQVYDFLSGEGRGEVVLISLKREGVGKGEDFDLARALVEYCPRASGGGKWWTGPKLPTLGEGRGKCVLVRRFKLPIEMRMDGFGINAAEWPDNCHDGVCSAGNGAGGGHHLRIQDWYGVGRSESISKKIGLTMDHLERAASTSSSTIAIPGDGRRDGFSSSSLKSPPSSFITSTSTSPSPPTTTTTTGITGPTEKSPFISPQTSLLATTTTNSNNNNVAAMSTSATTTATTIVTVSANPPSHHNHRSLPTRDHGHGHGKDKGQGQQGHPLFLNFLTGSNLFSPSCWPEKIAARVNPAVVGYLCSRHGLSHSRPSPKRGGGHDDDASVRNGGGDGNDDGGDGGGIIGGHLGNGGNTGVVVADWVGKADDWHLVRLVVGMNCRLFLGSNPPSLPPSL